MACKAGPHSDIGLRVPGVLYSAQGSAGILLASEIVRRLLKYLVLTGSLRRINEGITCLLCINLCKQTQLYKKHERTK